MTRPAVRPQSFIRSASTVLNATGYGFCTVTCPNNVRWKVTSSAVFTNISAAVAATTEAQPITSVYQDSAPNLLAYIEGSNIGDRDSSDTVYDLDPGQPVTAEWMTPNEGTAQADHAGLLATFVIRGEQTQVVAG